MNHNKTIVGILNDSGETALWWGVKNKLYSIVKCLSENSLKPQKTNEHIKCPIMEAAKSGNLLIFKHLIEKYSINLNYKYKDQNGMTLLIMAAK